MNICLIYSRGKKSGGYLRAKYLQKYLQKEGVNVEILNPIPNLPLHLDMLITLIKYTMQILFKKNDIIIALKPFPNACIPAIISKKIYESKIILDYDDLEYGYREGILSNVSKMITSPYPKRFDLVTTHNESLRNFLINDLKVKSEKIYMLEQGVDLEIFSNNKIKKIPSIKNLKKKNKVIVYIAHLDVSTDFDSIIKIFQDVKNKRNNTKLVVVGGGPLEKKFKKLVKEKKLEKDIIFVGYVQKEDIPSYMSAGDINIIYYEDKYANLFRVPMKMREYMIFPVPIISNDFGDLKKYEKYTYQSGTDETEFAKKIIQILKIIPDKRYLKGKKFIEKNYSWGAIIKPFIKKIKQLK